MLQANILGDVLSDRTVMTKYLNPNLVSLATLGPLDKVATLRVRAGASVGRRLCDINTHRSLNRPIHQGASRLTVLIVDVFAGAVIHSAVHDGVCLLVLGCIFFPFFFFHFSQLIYPHD